MNQILTASTPEQTRALIESKNYRTYQFPILGLVVKYRRPNFLQLALNKTLPAALADSVIQAYKSKAVNASLDAFNQDLEDKLKNDNTFLKDMSDKSYATLSVLVTSHRIMNVPESDFENSVIAYSDIPEDDALSFLVHLLNEAQNATTEGGGEVTSEDVTAFSDGGRKRKRRTDGESM